MALLVDQVNVTPSPITIEEGVAEKLTVGAGGGKAGGFCVEVGVLPPPHPVIAMVVSRAMITRAHFRKCIVPTRCQNRVAAHF